MSALEETTVPRLVANRDHATDEALVRYLRDLSIPLLYDKPSVRMRLVHLNGLLTSDPQITPTAISCSGENLYPEHRVPIQVWLGGLVINACVAEEAGQCPHRTGPHALADHTTVEVEGRHGSVGAVGAGFLLITNVRHAFVRFRLADPTRVTTGGCGCRHDGQTIAALPGCARAVYGDGDDPTPAEDLVAVPESAKDPIKQFQVAPGDRPVVVSSVPELAAEVRLTSGSLTESLGECFLKAIFGVRRIRAINTPGGNWWRFP